MLSQVLVKKEFVIGCKCSIFLGFLLNIVHLMMKNKMVKERNREDRGRKENIRQEELVKIQSDALNGLTMLIFIDATILKLDT